MGYSPFVSAAAALKTSRKSSFKPERASGGRRVLPKPVFSYPNTWIVAKSEVLITPPTELLPPPSLVPGAAAS